MLTPQNIKLQADKVADLYEQLQQQIFYLLIDATKDTRSLMEEHGRELEWRLKMLQKMGGLSKQVVKLVSQTSGLSERQIMELVEKNGLTVAKDINKQLAETLGQHQPISQDVRSIVSSYARQTFLNIDNNVNQTLITTNYANNTAVKMFQDIINKTTLDLIYGKRSGPQAMTDNILKWQDKGIKSAFVDKGGHNWSLEGYTRTVLDTTAQRVFNDVRIQSMKDFDSVLITMTSHPASRPACAPIQGRVVNIVPESDPRFDPEFDTIYNHGYGEPAGCFGINCQHMPYPYIKGVSHNFQKQYDPDEAVKNANIQAKLRYYERKVRALKKKLGVCDRIGDEERGMQIKGSIRSYQAKLRQIVKENDFLARDYSRERVYNKVSKKATPKPKTDSQKHVEAMLKNGDWSTKINVDKQKPHMKSTRDPEKHKSYLYDEVDPQELVNMYAGTGELETTMSGKYTNKEKIKAGKIIGVDVSRQGNEVTEIPTQWAKIHYSKNRTHVVPTIKRTD